MSTILKTATLSVLVFNLRRSSRPKERIHAHFPADRRKLPAKGQVQGYRYLLYNPSSEAKKKRKWPLLIFLHGRGERETTSYLVKNMVRRRSLRTKSPVHHCLSSMPRDRFMVETRRCRRFGRRALGQIPRRPGQSVPDRSESGRFRHLGYAARTPTSLPPSHRFAEEENRMGEKFGPIPIWNFHGDADKVVPVGLSRIMVEAVEKAGGRIKYTEYTGVRHDSWTQTYRNPKLYDWLLSHSRNKK